MIRRTRSPLVVTMGSILLVFSGCLSPAEIHVEQLDSEPKEGYIDWSGVDSASRHYTTLDGLLQESEDQGYAFGKTSESTLDAFFEWLSAEWVEQNGTPAPSDIVVEYNGNYHGVYPAKIR